MSSAKLGSKLATIMMKDHVTRQKFITILFDLYSFLLIPVSKFPLIELYSFFFRR